MKHYKIDICKFAELDNYQNGCDGKGQDHGTIDTKNFYSLEKLQAFISEIKDAYIHEDRIEYGQLENDSGYKVDTQDQEYQDFKAGKTDLWAVNYSIYISEVTIKEVQNRDLRSTFNLREE